ncbi:MAG: Gfo/Idh/MocA family oxidoreductase [Candidatus Hydrogenedentes bacterium]|nr:Gfo/Idh/MocA family oxidoreductase [Candidatus Hydrogenedentota bacterium]
MTRAQEPDCNLNRREFMSRSAAASFMVMAGSAALGSAANSRIKAGVIGQGGRGRMIAGMVRDHGGFEIVSVADYFEDLAKGAGGQLGVPEERCFSGLSGYKRVIDSGIEAVFLETPPYFFPEHAAAAVDAGLHVYMAKPVAVDVPGCLAIDAAAAKAGEAHRCFFVDYQMPTDPVNIEVQRRVADGGLGALAYVQSYGYGGGFVDPPKTETIESRLRSLTWVNDIALGCDYIGNYDIHAIDAALWAIGRNPVAASGQSRICRKDPHGDSRDVCSVVYEFEDGLVLNHAGMALPNEAPGNLSCIVYGTTGHAQLNYWGDAFLRAGEQSTTGAVENLYEAGAIRNIATFHENITGGRFENPTVRRSVDGCLATILGREAAARKARLTMDDVLKENRKLEVDLRGLKA